MKRSGRTRYDGGEQISTWQSEMWRLPDVSCRSGI